MKNYIIGAVVGISVAVAVFSVWGLFKQNARIYQLEVFAVKVDNLINQSQQTK